MDWMNYYDHIIIKEIEIKKFNNSGYLVLCIKIRNKDFKEEIHSLTVGIHKDKLLKYKNYEQLLCRLLSKITFSPYGYIEKYGLHCVTIEENE
jgi:hypothetical protein